MAPGEGVPYDPAVSGSVARGFPRRLPPGRPGDPGLFGPGSMAWRINAEGVLVLGGGRALLMQIAHPLVAAGVARHSGFPAAAFSRLWRTVEAMLAMSFGDLQQAREATARVTAVHRRVRGRAPGGRPYSATDPSLLLWVHATLVDSALLVYERFLAPLTDDERGRYLEESKRQAVLLGVPEEDLPRTLGDFRAYVAHTVAGLDVTDEARALARDIVAPPVPLPLRPAAELFRLVTVGLLPERLRDQYGYRWLWGHELALRATSLALRAFLPLVPSLLRRWPHARAAERRAHLALPRPGVARGRGTP